MTYTKCRIFYFFFNVPNKLIVIYDFSFIGAGGGGRTLTGITHQILNLARLPASPLRLKAKAKLSCNDKYPNQICKPYLYLSRSEVHYPLV